MPKLKRERRRSAPGPDAVPYARGFRPPSITQSRNAIGLSRNAKTTDPPTNAFTPLSEFFSPVPPPTSIDDWLAQYSETGQSYAQFLAECPWLSKRKRKFSRATFDPRGKTLPEKYPGSKVYLLPLGGFEGTAAPDFTLLAEYARLFFCLPVEVLPPVKFTFEGGSVFWVEPPSNSAKSPSTRRKGGVVRASSRSHKRRIDNRFHSLTGAIQLNAGSIISELRRLIPDDATCLMALTMADLFDSPPDLFVAGLAAGNQRVGVFSFSRYDPSLSFSSEFWHETTTLKTGFDVRETRRIVLQRSCKLLVHEVAHLLGVDHCVWFSCCMNGSGHLAEDFRQSMHLCPVDLRKLATLCGFDVTERYRALWRFFNRNGLSEEEEWVKRRIAFIEQPEK